MSEISTRTKNCKAKYEGKVNFCKDNEHSYTIKQFNSGSDVVIQFNNDSELQMHKSIAQINKGIDYPWTKDKDGNRRPIYFEDNFKKYMNSVFMTNEGYYVKVIDYQGTEKVTIQFTSAPYNTMVTTTRNLEKGQIHNPYKPNKFGGCIGETQYKNDKYEWIYDTWYNMLIRVNGTEYYNQSHNSSLLGNCYIAPDWLIYANYAEWYLSEYSKMNPNVSYEVDKELLYRFYKSSTNGMKCYSSNTCLLIPVELNNKLVNVTNQYAQIKSPYEMNIINASKDIKDCATKYHNMNALSDRAYSVIMNG